MKCKKCKNTGKIKGIFTHDPVKTKTEWFCDCKIGQDMKAKEPISLHELMIMRGCFSGSYQDKEYQKIHTKALNRILDTLEKYLRGD